MGNEVGLIFKDESWQGLCSQLEQLAVKGKHEECRRILNTHNPKKIPRTWAVNLAEIAWRVNLPLFALKALQSFIYPENIFDTPASDKEKVIYATSLSSLGAIKESIELLSKINGDLEPEALFHRASAHMYDWNYASAIPSLKKYIIAEKITPYRRLVGKVNLAACYIGEENWLTANELLSEIQAECEAQSYQLLMGNCLELKAQIEIFQGRYNAAIELLSQATFYLKNQEGFYLLYVEKWMFFCQCMIFKDDTRKHEVALEKLRALGSKALELGHWSTIRECDLLSAITSRDEALFAKVIMGTPSELYRQRARKLFNSNVISMGKYKLYLGKAGVVQDEGVGEFDPLKKQVGKASLCEKPLLFMLYHALTQDFYQPSTVGFLFEKIYPNEKFNPFSSPSRVLQLLRRLNTWFEENECPLRVEFKKSEFKLISNEGIYLIVQRGKRVSAAEGKFLEIRNSFRGISFNVANVAAELQISVPTADRILRKAFAEGRVVKSRNKFGVIYRLASPNQKKRTA